jgi:uncharacterized SAM-binding protein YcdF (DUF218 family)
VFFVASKLFWMLASPVSLLLIGAFAGILFCFTRLARLGRWLALVSMLVLIVASVSPIGELLLAPLEDRFPPPPADLPAPAGIIVLGGAIDDEASEARGQTVFDIDGERLTEAVILAKRYPDARVVYTGGTASLTPGATSSEALEAKKFMTALGIAPDRIILEDKSRNTEENARFTAAIVHPKPSERWMIVTSAFHMPRAMGVFEKAGFHPIAYPVGFRTLGPGKAPRIVLDPSRNLPLFQIALHEWIGLAAYRLSGRSAELFPGP